MTLQDKFIEHCNVPFMTQLLITATRTSFNGKISNFKFENNKLYNDIFVAFINKCDENIVEYDLQ